MADKKAPANQFAGAFFCFVGSVIKKTRNPKISGPLHRPGFIKNIRLIRF